MSIWVRAIFLLQEISCRSMLQMYRDGHLNLPRTELSFDFPVITDRQ